MQGTLSAPVPSISAPRAGGRRTLLVALFLGLLAAALTLAFLSSLGGRSEAAVPVASVVVARENIPAGKALTDGMLEVKIIPESAVIGDGFKAKAELVEQTLRYPVSKGEQIGRNKLVERAGGQALSFQIPAGLRGFTVPVNVTKSPAALLAPGDFVDVVASFELMSLNLPNARQANARTDSEFHGVMTMLQNTQVISVQRQYVENGVPYDPSVRGTPPKEGQVTYVTLAVTPEEAQALALVVDKAKLITLSLRPFGDNTTKEIPPLIEPIPVDLGEGATTRPANPSAPLT